jgi:twitching motility two-component system response regulator PilG
LGKVKIVKLGYEKVPPMSQLCTDSAKQIQSFHPIELLEQLSNSEANGYLQVSHGSVYWQIYFCQEQLTYATHSVNPFERIERHVV